MFALAPLQRLFDRVADAAMPRVREGAEHRLVRRHEMCRAAVQSAVAEGLITDAERSVLATLADQLDLGASEALAIERDVVPPRPEPDAAQA